jgi:hypothetical protein
VSSVSSIGVSFVWNGLNHGKTGVLAGRCYIYNRGCNRSVLMNVLSVTDCLAVLALGLAVKVKGMSR